MELIAGWSWGKRSTMNVLKWFRRSRYFSPEMKTTVRNNSGKQTNNAPRFALSSLQTMLVTRYDGLNKRDHQRTTGDHLVCREAPCKSICYWGKVPVSRVRRVSKWPLCSCVYQRELASWMLSACSPCKKTKPLLHTETPVGYEYRYATHLCLRHYKILGNYSAKLLVGRVGQPQIQKLM